MNLPKEEAIKVHAQHRFKERCTRRWTEELHKKIIKGIQLGKYKFIKRESSRRKVWEITIRKELYWVVYDRERKLIKTIWKKKNLMN